MGFIEDPTLPGPKTNWGSLPDAVDPDKGMMAEDYNALRQASLDLRTLAVAHSADLTSLQASVPPSTEVRVFEDFFTKANVNITTSGAGETSNITDVDSAVGTVLYSAVGLLRLNTNPAFAGGNGFISADLGGGKSPAYINAESPLVVEWRVLIEPESPSAAKDYSVRLGAINVPIGTGGATGIGFVVHHGSYGNANWHAFTRDGSRYTNTGIPCVHNTWYRLRAEYTPQDGATDPVARFYINGTLVATITGTMNYLFGVSAVSVCPAAQARNYAGEGDYVFLDLDYCLFQFSNVDRGVGVIA